MTNTKNNTLINNKNNNNSKYNLGYQINSLFKTNQRKAFQIICEKESLNTAQDIPHEDMVDFYNNLWNNKTKEYSLILKIPSGPHKYNYLTKPFTYKDIWNRLDVCNKKSANRPDNFALPSCI